MEEFIGLTENHLIKCFEEKHERTTAVLQNGGFSAKLNGNSSIELLCKTKHLCFDFRHIAKQQNGKKSLKLKLKNVWLQSKYSQAFFYFLIEVSESENNFRKIQDTKKRNTASIIAIIAINNKIVRTDIQSQNNYQ